MEKRVLSTQIADFVGSMVTVCGWIHKIRELGGITFLLIRDRAGIVQVVTDKSQYKLESVVQVDGTVVASKKAHGGAEIQTPTVTVLSEPQAELPLAINASMENYGIDTLLNQRLLSLRIPKMRALFEVQSTVLECFARYMRSQGFTEIKTSKLINSGTEGGTGLFEVAYFNTKVFLAQSPQFYKQAGMATGLERVFEIGAVYRAEKHETNRHLNEYISLDIEMGFIDSVHTLMDLEVDLMSAICEGVLQTCSAQITTWDASLPDPKLFERTPRVPYDEAKRIASNEHGSRILELDANAEKLLCAWAAREYGINAVFVYEFPRRKKPFYTMPYGQKTHSFDFLFNGVETTSGGLRIHQYNDIIESIKQFGMDVESLEDYLSVFKYGCPPHGGFAIGLERLTQKLLNCNNVKLASMFPRDRNRVTP